MVQEGYMLQTASFASPQHEIKETITELIGEEATSLRRVVAQPLPRSGHRLDESVGVQLGSAADDYNLFTLPIEEEPVAYQNTWLDLGFELTDSLVKWCKERQMYVILDLHAAPGGQGYDAAISDYDRRSHPFGKASKTGTKWLPLEAHRRALRDEPWVAGYDLLNEPNWISWRQRASCVVHAMHGQHSIGGPGPHDFHRRQLVCQRLHGIDPAVGRQFGLLSAQILEPQRGVGHAICHEHSNGVRRSAVPG